ncbi:MAG TPA: hypothetical protein VND93_27120, partial [Myxococcales bacterium]|nr:hypothetical protein [Myxococcales bacterium]
MASDLPLASQLEGLSGSPAVNASLSGWLLALQGRAGGAEQPQQAPPSDPGASTIPGPPAEPPPPP